MDTDKLDIDFEWKSKVKTESNTDFEFVNIKEELIEPTSESETNPIETNPISEWFCDNCDKAFILKIKLLMVIRKENIIV